MAKAGRKGTKRSDKRWIDEQGREWDSRFEWLVFTALQSAGHNIRRCNEGDSFSYRTGVTKGECLDCGSSKVFQNRIYTADIYVLGDQSQGERSGYLLELKGYWPAPKRSLFRAVSKQLTEEGINIRIVFESPYKMRGTQLTGPEYVRKYCKGIIPGIYNKKTEEIEWL